MTRRGVPVALVWVTVVALASVCSAGEAAGPAKETPRWGLPGPDGKLAYPPRPNPREPVDYIAWINKTFAVPDAENSAVDYLEAMRQLPALAKQAKESGESPAKATAQIMERLLTTLRRGAAKPKCFFTLYPAPPVGEQAGDSPPPTPGPPLESARLHPDLYAEGVSRDGQAAPLQRLLCSSFLRDACHAWHQGDRARTVRDAVDLARALRHLRACPQLLTSSVDIRNALREACLPYTILLGALSLFEDRPALAREMLPVLVARNPGEPTDRLFWPHMTFNALRLYLWAELQHGFVLDKETGAWVFRRAEYRTIAVSEEEAKRLGEIGFDATFRDCEALCDRFGEWLALPSFEATRRADALPGELGQAVADAENPLVKSWLNTMTKAASPSRATWLMIDPGASQVRRSTHVVCCILDHQARTGSLPESLDDLQGPGIKEVRIDPMTGKDFVYRKDGREFRLAVVVEEGPEGSDTRRETAVWPPPEELVKPFTSLLARPDLLTGGP